MLSKTTTPEFPQNLDKTPVELFDDAQVVYVDKSGFTSGTVQACLVSGGADWGGGKLSLVVSNDGERWEALSLEDLAADGYADLPDSMIARWRFVGCRISKSSASRKIRLTFHLVDDRARATVEDGGGSITVDGDVDSTTVLSALDKLRDDLADMLEVFKEKADLLLGVLA